MNDLKWNDWLGVISSVFTIVGFFVSYAFYRLAKNEASKSEARILDANAKINDTQQKSEARILEAHARMEDAQQRSEARILDAQTKMTEAQQKMSDVQNVTKRIAKELMFAEYFQAYLQAKGADRVYWHMRLQFENYDRLVLSVESKSLDVRIVGTTVSPDAISGEQKASEALDFGYVVEVASTEGAFTKGAQCLCTCMNGKLRISLIKDSGLDDAKDFMIVGLGFPNFFMGKGFSQPHPRLKDW